MDTLIEDRRIVRRILSEYAAIPFAYGDIRRQAVFDDDGGHYMVVDIGRNWDGRRVHDCPIHVDLIGGKFWVQHDSTDRPIALELEAAGIPRDRIVLGFREPELRPYTGYAVA